VSLLPGIDKGADKVIRDGLIAARAGRDSEKAWHK